MATSNSVEEIDIKNLKVDESTASASTVSSSKVKVKSSTKVVQPKKDKPKQEKVAATVVETVPVEELDFNRTPEEVEKALQEWLTTPVIYKVAIPNEKMSVLEKLHRNLHCSMFIESQKTINAMF
jgi:hypothetical protein